MPRSSSLAITIVRTGTAEPASTDEIRELIHAAIDAMNRATVPPGTSDPSGPAARAREPDGGAVRGPGPLRPGDRSGARA
jgi:hypothetical protein